MRPDVLETLLHRVAPICDLAIRIGWHWHDQGGVNGALLDELARLVMEPSTIAAKMREMRGAAAVSALGAKIEQLEAERDRLRSALHDALAEIDVLRKRPVHCPVCGSSEPHE